MSSKQLAALALATAALATIGCGSSSKGAPTSDAGSSGSATAGPTEAPNTKFPAVSVKVASGKPLTPARWTARGDAICAQLHAELESVSVKNLKEYPRVLPEAAAYVRTDVARLAKLVPPTTKANDWQQFLNASLRWAEDAAKLAEYPTVGNSFFQSQLYRDTVAEHNHLKEIAEHDGFKDCSLV